MNDEPFFLLIGSVGAATTSRLQARHIRYVSKVLNSGSKNWETIVALLQDPMLRGAIVRLNRHNYEQLTGVTREHYVDHLYSGQARVAPELLRHLAAVPHLVLVHEHIVAGEAWEGDLQSPKYEDGEYFEVLSEETRSAANSLFDGAGIQLTVYVRNVEADEIAEAFIDDVGNNLLFRMYVPAGSQYANEVSRLLEVFREWLTARGRRVRKEGYKTPRGEVIEFFAESSQSTDVLSRELAEFSHFVDLSNDPAAARAELMRLGVGEQPARDFVARSGKELKRILRDVRHEQERQLLELRRSMEDDVADEVAADIDEARVQLVVSQLVPAPGQSSFAPAPGRAHSTVINQQFFGAVNSVTNNPTASPGDGEFAAVLTLIETLAQGNPKLVQAANELADRTPNAPRGRAPRPR